MPHVIVKLWPGKSAEQKRRLSDAIVRDVTSILNYGDESVSVAFEEVSARDGRGRSTSQTSWLGGTSSPRSPATMPPI